MHEVGLDVLVDAAARRGQHVVDRSVQFGNAAAADGYGLDHRHSKLALERARIEFQSIALGKIDHVERDDRRQSKLDQLKRETQVIVEVRGVEDDDQCIGLALALLFAEQHVPGHRLVRACRIETV